MVLPHFQRLLTDHWSAYARRTFLHNFALHLLQATLTKMLANVLGNPSEPKYRKINKTNANFVSKVYGCKGAPELLQLAGFKDTVEAGFLVLPEAAELPPPRCRAHGPG